MTRVMMTPVGGTYSLQDFNATVAGNTWAFWDDSYHNNATIGECFAFVQNSKNGKPSKVIATGQIVGITEDTDPFVAHALLCWEVHQVGRRILLIRMDKEPAIQGTFDELFTRGGILMGTGKRTLLSSVCLKHNPFVRATQMK